MRIRLLFCALIVLPLAPACGGSSVGSNGLFNYTPKPPGNFAFQASPSPNAHAAIGSQGAAPTGAPRQTSPVVQAAKFVINIYGDTSSTPGFNPSAASIVKGTIIVFTNKDSQARSVATDPGDPAAFTSPMIAPGASWQWTASTVGTYNYHDGTRPYAVASFTVKAS